jgi:hypothetical protein
MMGTMGYTQGMTQLNTAPPIANKRRPKRECTPDKLEGFLSDDVTFAAVKDILSERGVPDSMIILTVSDLVIGG